jgi:hypothetical protein
VNKVDVLDEGSFWAINRPPNPLTLAEILEGIRTFRRGLEGRVALQMIFTEGNGCQAEPLIEFARSLQPDEIQLNTLLRPSFTSLLPPEKMTGIAQAFEGLPVRQVYEAQKPGVVILDPFATRLRHPEAGIATAMDEGGMECRRELP